MNWGKAIFEIREKAGLRQAELADAIGMTRASISNIETGRCVPGEDTLVKISAALNIDVPLIALLATCMGPMNIATRDIIDQLVPAGKTKILGMVEHRPIKRRPKIRYSKKGPSL